ncbi:MAG TPA: hypothetical protein VEB63_01400 [Chitinophagaceae bacterium]|nr:hypothetical protein [Chitinophagaceae bacterium]
MKSLAGILLLLTAVTGSSQSPGPTLPIRPGPPIYLRDVFSTHIDPKPYAGIQGSPFVDENWLLARILAAGRREAIDSIYIRINVHSGAVHFVNEEAQEMQMALRIREIRIIDQSSPLYNTVYLSGFDQANGFFEVVADGGKLKLLRRLRMFIWEYQPLGLEMQRRFEIQHDLYLCRNEYLFKPGRSCVAIAGAFGGSAKALEYISTKNLRCDREEVLRDLVMRFGHE